MDTWIDPSLIVYDDKSHSDKKSMFLLAAKRLGVNIEDCIIFEDSFTGIRCAKEIGCNHIIAIPLAQYREELEKDPSILFTIQDFKDPRLKEVI